MGSIGYNLPRWYRRRRAQLRREPLCAFCLAKGKTTAATIADHLVPHKNDEQLFWYGRLQSLCKPCHDGTKKEQENKGFATDIGMDGWPIDRGHPVYRNSHGGGGMNEKYISAGHDARRPATCLEIELFIGSKILWQKNHR
jgi:5-methylcytosine-specific restriction enzyme A